MTKKIIIASFAFLILALGVFSLLPCRSGEEPAVFSVPMGRGLSGISRDLGQQGFVRSGLLFRAMATLTGSSGRLKAGEYELPGGANPWEILSVLKSGKSLLHEFVVPEGYSSVQIADLLATQK